MERVIKNKIREKGRELFSRIVPNNAELDNQLNTASGLKIYKMAVDYPDIKCDFSPQKREGIEVELSCEFIVSEGVKKEKISKIILPEEVRLEKMRYIDNEIKITVHNANRTLSNADLMGLKFSVFPNDLNDFLRGYLVDFYKIVKSADLEKELYLYINKVENRLKEEGKKELERVEMLKEYLKEELEKE